MDEVWEHPAWPSDGGDPQVFAEALKDCLLRQRGSMDDHLHGLPATRRTAVFPVGETALQTLSLPEVQEALAGLGKVVAGDLNLCLRCLDKEQAQVLAEEAGLPVPQGCVSTDTVELDQAFREVGFPCVVKPVNSSRRLLGEKCVFVDSEEDRQRLFSTWPTHERLIVQERLNGRRHNCTFVAQGGRVLRYFESDVIRTHERNGSGYGTEVVAVSPSRRRRGLCERWIAHTGFEGIGCLQFMVDGDSERYLEINPRIDATIMLPWSCGFDFPLWAVQAASGDSLSEEVPSSAAEGARGWEGSRYQWLAGDIQGWLNGVFQKKLSPGESLRWFKDIIVTMSRSRYHATWSFRDPLPSLYLHALLALSTGKRLIWGDRR